MNWMIEYSLPLFIIVISIEKRSLNYPGAISALLLAYIILLTQNLNWFLVLFLFFLIGSIATKYREKKKRKMKIAQKVRSSKNVVSNGGMPMLMALLGGPIGLYGFVGSLATATADTVSSEVGVLSKEKPRMITSFKKVKAGKNGAITIFGTVVGSTAALLIGTASYLLIKNDLRIIAIAVIAGTLGNLIDSLIGAVFENKKKCGNSTTNFIATTSGAIIGMALGAFL